MRLQIIRIADRGVPNQERIHLSVQQEASLSYYVVLLSLYLQPDSVANSSLSAFWFPAVPLKPGDQIILYTGSGQSNVRPEPNGNKTYFFYWGFKGTIFSDPSQCVILVEAANWLASPRGA